MYRQRLSVFSRVAAICLLCLLLTSCGQQEQAAAKQQLVSSPKLTIGLIPEQSVFAQKKRYEPLLAYLAKNLGVAIEIKMLPRYGNIIKNFKELGLDGAFFGSFTGAMAIKALGVEPLARPRYVGGSSTYYGMLFVKKGSGIQTVQDMRGKRMVFVDRATTAGFLLPLHYFKSQGIQDYTRWFREYYFSGTHEDAIYDVLTGMADVGAAKNTVFYRLAAEDSRITRELEILATSPHVPSNTLAVRPDLDKELQRKLAQQLLDMHRSQEGRAILAEMNIEAFIATTADDFQPVIAYAAGIGLDLKTYNYLND